MSSLTLGLLLHFYQPPGQSADVLARIADQSYRPLLRVIRGRPNLRASVNINAVTVEMLRTHGHRDVIVGLRDLALSGQIELTGSGAYHPILPLIPPDEAARQIALSGEQLSAVFNEAYLGEGFFPPEMACGPETARQVAAGGFRWMLVSGIACPVTWPLEWVHRVEDTPDLAVLFRDDILSNIIAFRSTDVPGFIGKLRALLHPRNDRYVVIAMDAETFGHHIAGWEEEFLGRLYDVIARRPAALRGRGMRGLDTSFIHPAKLSEIVDQFEAGAPIPLRPSSWSTSAADIAAGVPYPLWLHPDNQAHDLLWRHLDQTIWMVMEARRTAPDTEEYRSARGLLDRALCSDPSWWASRRPHWSPGLVQRGLNLQREALLPATRAILRGMGTSGDKRAAEDRLAAAHTLAGRLELLLAQL